MGWSLFSTLTMGRILAEALRESITGAPILGHRVIQTVVKT